MPNRLKGLLFGTQSGVEAERQAQRERELEELYGFSTKGLEQPALDPVDIATGGLMGLRGGIAGALGEMGSDIATSAIIEGAQASEARIAALPTLKSLRQLAQKGIRGVDIGVESVKDVSDIWKKSGVDNFISERPQSINLAKIVVPKEARGTGVGTDAMKVLTDYADKARKKIELTPSPDFGGTKKRLIEFYKRHGFVENKGRNKDFEISEAMYRTPK